MSNVTEILVSQYNINARVGQKTKCPFCGHHSFSITKDDSLGKCFHPSCLKYITPYKKRHKHKAIIDILERLYLVSKTELLNQQNTQSNAYDYLVNERQLHPIVIAHSMIGIMPASYDIDVEFEPIINEIENKAKDKDSSKKLDDIYSIRQKLREVIYKGAEWLVFYYCDAYHNIISMKLRKPYDKKFMSFKLPDYGTGVFGQDLFSPIAIDKVKHQNEKLIVVEGEFDILQLQSLMARKAEIEGISLENHYINGCAVGSVNSADIETISKISKNPVICYDNDNGAGFELVKKAQQSITVSATTTPDDFKDIDDYIKSFDDDYNGAFKAVKDLFANSQKHFKEIESVKKRVGGIRAGREDDSLRAFEKNDLIGQVIADDMSERGKFYYDQNHIYYFDEIGKILILIHKDSLEFKITLFEYGINASENTFSYILEFLLVYGIKYGTKTEVYQFSYYNPETFTLYWFNNDNQIYKITSDNIKLIDNGTDGVLFLYQRDYTPNILSIDDNARKLYDDCSEQPLLDKYLISRVNFEDNGLTLAEKQQLLELWFYSLFFESIMPTKPILAILGEAGSGKSMTIRQIGKLLFGDSFNVMCLTNDAKDFDSAVSNNYLVAIDNVDTSTKWLNDKLAAIATGTVLQKRKYYTTNDQETISIRCFLALTSNNPHFRREDITDRLLLLRVARIEKFVSEGVLLKEISNNRQEILTEIAFILQEIIQCLKEESDKRYGSNFRMADFADFAIKIGKGLFSEETIRDIFIKLKKEQSMFTLENDEIVELLYLWIDRNPAGREITSSQLCSELSSIAENINIPFFYKDKPRSFAQRLSRLKRNLQELFVINERKAGGNKKFYSFKKR